MKTSIEDIVNYVNHKMKQGLSMAQIEKEMKVGKDTIRKKLNRANYAYNKDLNQYITQNNTDVTQGYNTDTTQCVITQNKTDITQGYNTDTTQCVITQECVTLTEEEIGVLKEIIRNYKQVKNNNEFEGVVVTRSIRTYKNILDEFSTYCKEKNLSQKDSIAKALRSFMEGC